MTIKKEVEFNMIVNDILNNREFIELKYELHHGISRMEHSLKVAKLSYGMCKFFKVKRIVETTRAALLHDFYKNIDVSGHSFVNHPEVASKNAKVVFNVNEFEENIIASHMFPVSKVMPKSKESILVSCSDKIVAVKECTQYKVPLTIGAAFLFFINFLFIQR